MLCAGGKLNQRQKKIFSDWCAMEMHKAVQGLFSPDTQKCLSCLSACALLTLAPVPRHLRTEAGYMLLNAVLKQTAWFAHA